MSGSAQAMQPTSMPGLGSGLNADASALDTHLSPIYAYTCVMVDRQQYLRPR